MRSPLSPSVPEVIADRYEDRGSIGHGGMGEVRRVYDRQLERFLAMKILADGLVAQSRASARFLTEARLTAQLQHPSIVSVHDHGVLDDGRLWFTMREVRGRTLAEVIDDLHARCVDGEWPTDGEVTLHRVLDAFRRLCEGVAYAHSRGVIHRDLKPSNMMVGEFGEVQVMDWGLAKRVGQDEGARVSSPPIDSDLTQDGELVGTISYMSPEQARGNHGAHSLRSDVWSLGACLRRILTNRPPVEGRFPAALTSILMGNIKPIGAVVSEHHPPIPAQLVAICERAMAQSPESRFADAATLAEELGGWLDGAQRRERALEIVEEAASFAPHIERLRVESTQRRNEAGVQLRTLPYGAAAEDKHVAWELEDQSADLAQQASLLEVQWLQQLRSALEVAPDLPEAHERLAEHYRARLLDADARRDAHDAARNEALLRVHDRGKHTVFLRGEGKLSLKTVPAGARVTAYRYEERRRRLVAEPHGELGVTPLLDVVLPRGSYLLMIEHAERAPVRYPVLIERGEHWDGIAPGETRARAVPLPPADAIEDGFVYVPGGWFVSGDPRAAESLPRRMVWVEPFLASRGPVTNGELLRYVNELVRRGESAEAERSVPRVSSDEATPMFEGPDAEGLYRLPADGGDDGQWLADRPVTNVDWFTASAYARAHGGRLPNELEWEKLARGVDGRAYACGDHLEASWANIAGKVAEGPRRVSVGSVPEDVSPYLAVDTIGNVREWCRNVWRLEGPHIDGGALRIAADPPAGDEARAARGGAYHSVPELARPGVRFAGDPRRPVVVLGFRVVRDVAR